MNTAYKGRYVAKYIKDITPNKEMIPDFWINEYVISNNFELKELDLQELINTLEDFVPEHYDRYTWSDRDEAYLVAAEYYIEPEVTHETIYNPIVVVGNKLIDGYSRVSELYRKGEETITAFVAV